MKRRSKGEWAKLVGKWKASGLTAEVFGKRRRLNPRTLTYWNWRLGKERREAPRRAARRAELPSFTQIALAPAPAVVEIVIGDATVRVPAGTEAALVRDVVRGLRGQG